MTVRELIGALAELPTKDLDLPVCTDEQEEIVAMTVGTWKGRTETIRLVLLKTSNDT